MDVWGPEDWDDGDDGEERPPVFPDDFFLCDGPCELMVSGVPLVLFSVDEGGCATGCIQLCYECADVVLHMKIEGERVERRRVDGRYVDTIGAW